MKIEKSPYHRMKVVYGAERNRTARDISEMLQIKIREQPINKQEDTQKLSCMYSTTLQKVKHFGSLDVFARNCAKSEYIN